MVSLRKLYPYRLLAATLVVKELKSRYRGSFMGFFWTMLNPLFMMLVYTLVFSVYMRIPIENYAVFVFAGLLPWIWFSSSVLQSTVSIIQEGHLLKKVIFPSEILPFVAVASTLVNFLLSLPLYILFCFVFGVSLGWPLLALPLLILLGFVIQYGLALTLSAANVFFRDVEHLTGNIITLLFFLTPILYPLTSVPERFRGYAMLNPLAPLILSYRDILFYGRWPQGSNLALLAVWGVLFLAAGEVVFRLLSPRFAEEI